MLHPEFPLTLAVTLEDYLLGGALDALAIHLQYPNLVNMLWTMYWNIWYWNVAAWCKCEIYIIVLQL